MATRAFSTVKDTLTEPVVTGGLLYLLARGPPHIRERFLQPFQNNLLAKNGVTRIAALIAALKVLTTLGVAKRISQALNRIALNNWSLRRPGAPFKFGPGKEELVIVTGGSSGFGYEMVKSFAKHARVVALDVSPFPPELERLQGVHYYRCDVTDTPAVVSLCEEIRNTHGDATVLVNNAGIAVGKTVLDTTNEETERLFKVNLISHFALIREFLPGMLRMKKGHIVTIASMASFFAVPGLLDYSCTKIGALYLNDGIRAECLSRYPGGEGVCFTSVHPSWHATGIIKGVEKALERHGVRPDPPSNVSDLVVQQVLKGKSGRIHVPLQQETWAGTRGWPLWLQDVLGGLAWKKRSNRLRLGSDEDSTLDKKIVD